MSRFCIAKAPHILQQIINVFENTFATTVNEFVMNELVKITVLWKMGLGDIQNKEKNV